MAPYPPNSARVLTAELSQRLIAGRCRMARISTKKPELSGLRTTLFTANARHQINLAQ
jgi:hypothetical protein